MWDIINGANELGLRWCINVFPPMAGLIGVQHHFQPYVITTVVYIIVYSEGSRVLVTDIYSRVLNWQIDV